MHMNTTLDWNNMIKCLWSEKNPLKWNENHKMTILPQPSVVLLSQTPNSISSLLYRLRVGKAHDCAYVCPHEQSVEQKGRALMFPKLWGWNEWANLSTGNAWPFIDFNEIIIARLIHVSLSTGTKVIETKHKIILPAYSSLPLVSVPIKFKIRPPLRDVCDGWCGKTVLIKVSYLCILFLGVREIVLF